MKSLCVSPPTLDDVGSWTVDLRNMNAGEEYLLSVSGHVFLAGERREGGLFMAWNWRSVLKATAFTSLAISVFAIIAFEPELPVVIGILTGVGLLWLRRPGKGGAIYLGLIHLLVGLMILVLFQGFKELAYPASWMVFVTNGARLIVTMTAIVATVGALMTNSGNGGPRAVMGIALVALLSVIGVGIGSRLSVEEERRRPGDVVMKITSETEWSTKELRVPAGRVSVFVKNDDVHHGSFSIDGVVDVDIPAGTSKRAAFSVAPGRYRFYSKLYPGESEMRGMLEAS